MIWDWGTRVGKIADGSLAGNAGNDDRRYEHDRVGLSPRKPDLFAYCDGRMVAASRYAIKPAAA